LVAKTKKPHVLGQIIMVEGLITRVKGRMHYVECLGISAMEISRERAFLAEGAPSSGGWITHVHSNSINQRLE